MAHPSLLPVVVVVVVPLPVDKMPRPEKMVAMAWEVVELPEEVPVKVALAMVATMQVDRVVDFTPMVVFLLEMEGCIVVHVVDPEPIPSSMVALVVPKALITGRVVLAVAAVAATMAVVAEVAIPVVAVALAMVMVVAVVAPLSNRVEPTHQAVLEMLEMDTC